MNRVDRGALEGGRRHHRRDAQLRWKAAFKTLLGFSAVLAVMSAVLFADISPRSQTLVEFVASDE
jgi:hypothetical protein